MDPLMTHGHTKGCFTAVWPLMKSEHGSSNLLGIEILAENLIIIAWLLEHFTKLHLFLATDTS